MKIVLLILAICVSSSTFASKKIEESCLVKFTLEDYEIAYQICLDGFKRGDDLQVTGFVLGEIVNNKLINEVSTEDPLRFYLPSAALGYAPSMLVVGHLYNARGAKTDAEAWYRASAFRVWNGSAYSLDLLSAILYENQDYYWSYVYSELSKKLGHKAAERSYVMDQSQLAAAQSDVNVLLKKWEPVPLK